MEKILIVSFDRATGRVLMVDSGPEYSFARGAATDASKAMLAFLVPGKDFVSSKANRNVSKVQRLCRDKGINGLIAAYPLTEVPSLA